MTGKRIWTHVCLVLLVGGLAAGPALAREKAEDLVKNGDAETGDATNWKGWGVVSEGAHQGRHCFTKTGNATIMSTAPIPVDPMRAYKLSGWFQSAGEKKSHLYFGYAPLDENKRAISPLHVNVIEGTETRLAAPCGKGDTVLKVEDGSKWKTVKHAVVAFEVDASGDYADLPNRNISTPGVVRVEDKGAHWEIELAKGCGRNYVAGTMVREHQSAGTYIYNAASRATVPAEWKQYTGYIGGELASGISLKTWWPGTRYCRILVLANYHQKDEAVLLADGITMVPAP